MKQMQRAKKNQKKKVARKRDLSLQVEGNVKGFGSGKAALQYVNVPAAKSAVARNVQPQMNARGGQFVIRHREFLGDVLGSTGYSVESYPINPALEVTFPWGAGIAQNYEQYQIRSLRFCYETQAPTTDPGTVMLAIDYDPADAPPIDKPTFMSMAGAVRGPVWNRFECSAMKEYRQFDKLYTRTTGLAANQDVKTYDYGVLNVAVQGSALDTVGELYVEYEIALLTPQTDSQQDDVFEQSYAASVTSTGPSSPFTTLTQTGGGMALVKTSVKNILWPRTGSFLVTYTLPAGVASGNGVVPTYIIVSGSGSVTNLSSGGYGGGFSSAALVTIGAVNTVISTDFGNGYPSGSASGNYCVAPFDTSAAPGPVMTYQDISLAKRTVRKEVKPSRLVQPSSSSSSSPSDKDVLPVHSDIDPSSVYTEQELTESRERFMTEVRRALCPLGITIGPAE